ncbi:MULTISPECIES: hypothetical protein [unclassified Caballeronia]|uniref:hypothetical protein n=1 Tax=unclassified Caballeronia TaxID=2646786 RepID=UPI001F1D434A|nr:MULTISPECIES: hypothetical protein [unclassified Caballeronia]MCE4540880.1 hypothetical protein [Caballeronia sp. PC1]MCE4570077.1 hypothetical protein [Caballeronia sp. CLC5]
MSTGFGKRVSAIVSTAILLSAAASVLYAPAGRAAPTTVQDVKWMVGKLPSEVVGDQRFRKAFNELRPNEWKRIVERFGASDIAGVQLKDGFYFASGCKQHACSSDLAAFAISASTGEGSVMYRATVNEATGKTVTRSFSPPDTPIERTPLAAWAKENAL